MVGKQFKSLVAVAAAVAVLAGCSGQKEQTAAGGSTSASTTTVSNQAASREPVTISLGVRPGYLSDEEIERYFVEPTKKKYPHITINRIWLDDKANSFDNLVMRGEVPDIIVYTSLLLGDMKRLGLEQDLNGLIQSNKLDTGRFNPATLEAVKLASEKEALIAIPYTYLYNSLYYNKDIFDKFGVSYPKDGMTWPEATELAKKLTRVEDGEQYRGLEPDSVFRAGSQLGLPLVDPKTLKSIGNTDKWKKVVEMVKGIYEIPGNGTIQTFTSGMKAFTKDRRLAMLASVNPLADFAQVKNEFTNWDLASYPVWPEMPGIGTQYDLHLMIIPSVSKHKDAAIQVASVVVSDEVQLDMARSGKLSVLKDKKFQDEFGKKMDHVQGKNVQAIFKTTPAKPFPPTVYGSKAFNEITKVMTTVVKNKVDINTALRSYDELMDKYIEENKQK
ncbi:ABC transporter substrate-binding protein [Paenibacillus mesophilus]|uniref:ABC transporter substrate-binding protein n=1 Tax=Paenibacillus mesophilus TaxID=2582849 RepID=UPI0013053AD3|nr:extracellular solute-binding protein [Paenibacillus mesophilus]